VKIKTIFDLQYAIMKESRKFEDTKGG